MAKKPLICKLCGGEMGETEQTSPVGDVICGAVWCSICEIFVYADTLLDARNKARKLMEIDKKEESCTKKNVVEQR